MADFARTEPHFAPPEPDGTAAPRALGVFGGSFDPPHLAHLALARAAIDTLQLDRLHWLPAGQAWQKQREGRVLAPGEHRAAMSRRLCAEDARILVDTRELRRAGPSYTVDTLRELSAEHPFARLWLVIGQDQYARLHTWHDWRELLHLAGVAVAARDGEAVRADPGVASMPHELRVLPMPAMPHSSSEIRRQAAAGLDVSTLAGPAVAQYISRHPFYPETPVSPAPDAADDRAP